MTVRARLIRIWAKPHWWAEFASGLTAVAWAKTDMFSGNDISTIAVFHGILNIVPHCLFDITADALGVVQILSLYFEWSPGRFASSVGLIMFYAILMLTMGSAPSGPFPNWSLAGGFVGINMLAATRATRSLP